MNMQRRGLLRRAAGAAVLLATTSLLHAATFSLRPLRWIVGFPAGGAADIIARIIAAQLSDQLRQQVVVENKPGAGTSLATSALLSAPPDGHTMLMLGSSTIVHALTQGHHQQDALENIVPVAGLTVTAFVVAVHASSPYVTLSDLIDDARTNPGKLRVGSYGVGTQSQMAAYLFSMVTGIDVVHVPYRGGAPLIIDLLGRHIHLAFDTVASSLPHIRDGTLRALAVTTADRLRMLPDIPAAAEIVRGYEVLVWTGVGAPRDTPRAIVQKLSSELKAALNEPKVIRKLAELAVDPMPYGVDEFRMFWAAEADRTRKLIEKIGIKSQ